MSKTDGHRNQAVGKFFEKQVAKKFRKAGFVNATYSTSRSVRDNEKVDIMNEDEDIFGRIPYNIQCKTLAKHCDYTKLLAEMPKGDEVNVIIHRKTKKDESGNFIKQGTYAIMNANDFYDMVAELNARKL